MSAVRILVVEDEPVIRLFVACILADAGFQVEAAANAVEALRQMGARSLLFDAVIIDVGLPAKWGRRARRRIARDAERIADRDRERS